MQDLRPLRGERGVYRIVLIVLKCLREDYNEGIMIGNYLFLIFQKYPDISEIHFLL
jgi:hypothetical protein